MTERQHELIRRRLEGKTVALHTDCFTEETEAIRALMQERNKLLEHASLHAQMAECREGCRGVPEL